MRRPAVMLEYEIAPVPAVPGPACAFDGRPGPWPSCCTGHGAPMCAACRDTKGAHFHRNPKEIST